MFSLLPPLNTFDVLAKVQYTLSFTQYVMYAIYYARLDAK